MHDDDDGYEMGRKRPQLRGVMEKRGGEEQEAMCVCAGMSLHSLTSRVCARRDPAPKRHLKGKQGYCSRKAHTDCTRKSARKTTEESR